MQTLQLLLKDYVALLRVGVLSHERAAPQRVQVNVMATLAEVPDADALDQTYDYTQMIAEVDRLAATHVDLLETFASRLAKNILSNCKINHIEIALTKLDILDNGRVGVRFVQDKAA